jgi:antirestriction protein ArdC
MATEKSSPTQRIFDAIQEQLQKGTVPWHKPWVVKSDGIVSHKGTGYSLRNRMLLMYAGEYLTFQQAIKEGGCVRKGEHGQTVFFAKHITVKNKDTGEDEDKYILKAWTVFRTEQCDNIQSKFEHLWKNGGEPKEDAEAMQIVNDYCERCGVRRVNGGAKAFYYPDDHCIQVPGYKAYTERSLYWSTMFHELGHSTARFLNRKQGGTFGSSQYAREELVAEICAALCLGALGIDTQDAIINSAAYIKNWQTKITNIKPSEFGDACRLAEQAHNLIFNKEGNNA